jgi:hypothetical protein
MAVTTQNPVLDLARVTRIYQATRSLAFADIPAVDIKDRLSVLTVGSGLRTIGVLETWGQRLPQIRDRMINHGMATSVSTCVWSSIERPVGTPHRAVLRALDERRVAGKPKHVLWLYAGPQEREQYRQTSFTQQQAGQLLGYPPCCVAFESRVMEQLPQAQLEALIAETGGDDARLMDHLGRVGKLAAPKIALPDNALRTEQRLPFALHVACDACLDDSDSASAVLNAEYGELARRVDARFHALSLAVQETYCQITGDQSKNRELLLQVRLLHEKFFKSRP